ncbi:hypothetical protein GCM10009740_06200 [Terrabacter terrae]|uniref:GAF domain-containing protein n=1 Tax=Terrabacter terrae TaxID=318434 RepID=A0ABN2TTV3_9MICO
MEPLPETRRVLASLAEYGEEGLSEELDRTAEQVQQVAPEVVGFSVAVVSHGVTLTYVVTHVELAVLDAVQYLDGGPCVQAAHDAQTVQVENVGLLDEGRWQFFAQAAAAHGIMSTLSMPVLNGDAVIGGVNLYGSTAHAFEGREEKLAELFGAWAPGAIANADLGFTTRLEAAKAPGRLHDLHTVDLAVGVLVAAKAIPPDEARADLEHAAAQAGIQPVTLARAVIQEHLDEPLAATDDPSTANEQQSNQSFD